MAVLTLTTAGGPIDLDFAARFLARWPPATHDGWSADGALRLAFVRDDLRGAGGVTLRAATPDSLTATLAGGATEAQVRRIFCLDLEGDEPRRPVLFAHPYEAAAWAIISTRVPAARAAALRRTLIAEHGERHHARRHDTTRLPPAARVARSRHAPRPPRREAPPPPRHCASRTRRRPRPDHPRRPGTRRRACPPQDTPRHRRLLRRPHPPSRDHTRLAALPQPLRRPASPSSTHALTARGERGTSAPHATTHRLRNASAATPANRPATTAQPETTGRVCRAAAESATNPNRRARPRIGCETPAPPLRPTAPQ